MAWKLTLPCTRDEAEAINLGDVLGDIDPAPALMTSDGADGWHFAMITETEPDPALIAQFRALVPSADGVALSVEQFGEADWVTLSQAALAPVEAGRFYIHTASNKGHVPAGAIALQIEAARAFGTGGHDTTAGCLAMLSGLAAAGARHDHIIDIGTGTGVLAFAAHRLWPRAYVTASDIDPVSIDIAAENAAVNAVPLGPQAGRVALCVAAGIDAEAIVRRAPYDLVIANILAGPLIELAPHLGAVLRDGGSLILAGLLDAQADRVIAAYRAQGFRLAQRWGSKAWPCLHMRKRARYGWQRPLRLSSATGETAGFGSL